MAALWIGVDPGGKTGIVAVDLAGGPDHGEVLRHFETITRPPSVGFEGWADQVLEHVLALRRRLLDADIADPVARLTALPARIAVEFIVPGTMHLGRINPDGVACAATIAGYLLGWGRGQGDTVAAVRPGRHGRHQPLRSWYPRELVGPRVVTGSGDKHEHERAALDIARTAPTAIRWRQTRTRSA
jgi:hypothetical protein